MKTSDLLNIIMAMLLVPSMALAQAKIIAHRGYWQTEGSAQNSIASLQKAADVKAYGSEFDVIITKDGIPVIHHDDSIAGKRIEETPYSEIKDTKLSNGETLPTLDDYLKKGKTLNTQMILEIKPHLKVSNEDLAVAVVTKMVQKYKMEKQVEYISFSLNICEELHKASPSSKVAYLGSNLQPEYIKKKGLTGIDYYYTVFDKFPTWIDDAHRCGLEVNAWTIDSLDDINRINSKHVDYITTDVPVEALKLVK